MKTMTLIKTLALTAFAVVSLSAFSRAAFAEGKGEKAGKKVDAAADKTEEAGRNAKRKTKRGVKRAGEKMEDAGKRTQDAAE